MRQEQRRGTRRLAGLQRRVLLDDEHTSVVLAADREQVDADMMAALKEDIHAHLFAPQVNREGSSPVVSPNGARRAHPLTREPAAYILRQVWEIVQQDACFEVPLSPLPPPAAAGSAWQQQQPQEVEQRRDDPTSSAGVGIGVGGGEAASTDQPQAKCACAVIRSEASLPIGVVCLVTTRDLTDLERRQLTVSALWRALRVRPAIPALV